MLQSIAEVIPNEIYHIYNPMLQFRKFICEDVWIHFWWAARMSRSSFIDDGSSDRTGAIADEYEMLYPNIVKAVHKPNGGHGSGVNKGLELAHGLYYKVVDSDDWFDRDAYLKMLDKIKSFEVAQFPDLIICNYVYDHLDEGIQNR